MKRQKLFILLFIVFFSFPSNGLSFDDKTTHKDLSDLAVTNSHLSQYLLDQLNITKIDTNLALENEGYEIPRWIQEGSYEEDQPSCRASSHFHDPIVTTWSEAKLTDPNWVVDRYCDVTSPFREKYSALIWATGYSEPNIPNDPPVNNNPEAESNGRNWDVARDFFYQALTSEDPIQREANLAQTFNTLGYILHLLQDMASPAHTRNDFLWGHSRDVGCPDGKCEKWYKTLGNPFEAYVRDYYNEIRTAINSDPKLEISLPYTGEKTLTNFWDTNTYKPDVSPPTDSRDIGLAEYSNGNFVSYASVMVENQNDKHYFPYPNRKSIEDPGLPDHVSEGIYEVMKEDGRLDKSIYIKKTGHGEIIDKFLTWRYVPFESATFMIPYYLSFMPDKACFLEYAKRLIPRAVGYSAELINYFLRGRLDVQLGRLTYASDSTIISAELYVKNMTPSSVHSQYIEVIENGVLDVVYSYIAPGQTTKTYEVVKNVYSIQNAGDLINSQHVSITPTLNIPVGASDISFMIVFHGKLGDEYNAVAAQIYKFDNSRLAYYVQPGGRPNTSNIYTISPDGSDEYQITNAVDPNPWHFAPAWSKDGTRMAFESEQCTDPSPDMLTCPGDSHFRDIVVVDLLSKIKYPDNVLFRLNYNGDPVANPSFSPDGNMIAAIKRTPSGMNHYGSIVVFDLINNINWVVNTDDDPELTELWGSIPTWAPSGDIIAYALFSQYDPSVGMKFEGDIFLIDPFTGAKNRLTNDDFNNTEPSWSTDGERIVFSSDRDGQQSMDIWIMDKNGTNLSKLYDCSPASCYTPNFSPDGQYVAFGNGASIYIVESTGAPDTLKEIANFGSLAGGIVWSPYLTRPSFTDIQAEPSTISAGGFSTISWQSDKATEVTIDGIAEKQAVDGSINVSPDTTTTYTLTAVGPTGKTISTVTVLVE